MAWLHVPGCGLFLVAKMRLDAWFIRVRLALGDVGVAAGPVDHTLQTFYRTTELLRLSTVREAVYG